MFTLAQTLGTLFESILNPTKKAIATMLREGITTIVAPYFCPTCQAAPEYRSWFQPRNAVLPGLTAE